MTMDVAPNTDASMCHLQYVTNATRRFLKKKKKVQTDHQSLTTSKRSLAALPKSHTHGRQLWQSREYLVSSTLNLLEEKVQKTIKLMVCWKGYKHSKEHPNQNKNPTSCSEASDGENSSHPLHPVHQQERQNRHAKGEFYFHRFFKTAVQKLSSKTAYFYQNSSGALILTRTRRTISLKLQVSVKKLTFWSAHKNPAQKVRLKVVSTGVEQLLQLFTAPTPKRSLLGLASARDTKKQAPRAGNLTRGTRGQAARR